MRTKLFIRKPDYQWVRDLVDASRADKIILDWLDTEIQNGIPAFHSEEVQNALLALPGFGKKALHQIEGHLQDLADDFWPIHGQDSCQTCQFWQKGQENHVTAEGNLVSDGSDGSGLCRLHGLCSRASDICGLFRRT